MCNSSGCGPQGPRGCSEGAEWGAGSWPLRKTQLQPVRNRPFQPPRSGPCPLPGCQGRGQVGGIPVWQGRAHVRPPPCSHPLVIAGQVSPTIRQVSPPSTSHPKYKRGGRAAARAIYRGPSPTAGTEKAETRPRGEPRGWREKRPDRPWQDTLAGAQPAETPSAPRRLASANLGARLDAKRGIQTPGSSGGPAPPRVVR